MSYNEMKVRTETRKIFNQSHTDYVSQKCTKPHRNTCVQIFRLCRTHDMLQTRLFLGFDESKLSRTGRDVSGSNYCAQWTDLLVNNSMFCGSRSMFCTAVRRVKHNIHNECAITYFNTGIISLRIAVSNKPR